MKFEADLRKELISFRIEIPSRALIEMGHELERRAKRPIDLCIRTFQVG